MADSATTDCKVIVFQFAMLQFNREMDSSTRKAVEMKCLELLNGDIGFINLVQAFNLDDRP